MALLLAMSAATGAGAQSVADLADRCAEDAAQPDPVWCMDAALAAQAAQGDMALLAAGGAAVPGTASTVGKRVGSSPRWSFGARLAGVGFQAPALSGPSTGPAVGRSAWGVGLQGSAALGVFRGLSPTPTMGGVLSLDLVATGALLWGPRPLGHRGTDVAYGLGARVGIFRESFTLPGITVSAAQRWIQGMDLVWSNGGTRGSLRMGTSTTSIRALIGKDLWGIGWLGGVGWDRSGSDGTVTTPAGAGTSFHDLDNDRRLAFFGASWSYFVVQVSGEVGWASGWSSAARTEPAYDPDTGRFFGGLAVRFIY